jgi:hypothetical protein
MDDKLKTGRADDSRINIKESYELQYWSENLNVSQEELKKAVESAGPLVEDVRDYFSKNK